MQQQIEHRYKDQDSKIQIHFDVKHLNSFDSKFAPAQALEFYFAKSKRTLTNFASQNSCVSLRPMKKSTLMLKASYHIYDVIISTTNTLFNV